MTQITSNGRFGICNNLSDFTDINPYNISGAFIVYVNNDNKICYTILISTTSTILISTTSTSSVTPTPNSTTTPNSTVTLTATYNPDSTTPTTTSHSTTLTTTDLITTTTTEYSTTLTTTEEVTTPTTTEISNFDYNEFPVTNAYSSMPVGVKIYTDNSQKSKEINKQLFDNYINYDNSIKDGGIGLISVYCNVLYINDVLYNNKYGSPIIRGIHGGKLLISDGGYNDILLISSDGTITMLNTTTNKDEIDDSIDDIAPR